MCLFLPLYFLFYSEELNGTDIEIIFKVAAVGLIVAVLNQVLTRSGRDEYTMITTLAGLIIVIMMVLPYVGTMFSYVRSVFDL